MDDEARQPAPLPPGTYRLGKIAGVDVLVRASWLVVAALIAVLMAPGIERVSPGLGALTYVAGLAFAVLLYLSILLHEASHAIAARHFGLPVKSISIHFLGGVTELGGEAPTPWAEFVIAVVGPLTSIAVGAVSLGLWALTPDGLIGLALRALAVTNLAVGVLNLVPGLPLDGGRVLRAAVWHLAKDQNRATVAAAWGGRVAAVLALCWPIFQQGVLGMRAGLTDYLMAAVIASFLWGGATASLVQARMRRRLPAISARPLARRVIVVPEDLPVAEAVRRAQEAEAGAIAIHTADDRVTGLVNEVALESVPAERRPWLAVSTVSRTMEDGLRIPVDLAGEDLLQVMTTTPATEYLLVETDGRIYGMLVTADVERAFAATA
ncbi:MAG: site-2 protease family protein [Marmoricola sp.]